MLAAHAPLERFLPYGKITPFQGQIDQRGCFCCESARPAGTEGPVLENELNHLSIPLRESLDLPPFQFLERVVCATHLQLHFGPFPSQKHD